MSLIFLIGFMGSGKTTAGKQLAAKMNYEFLDLDHYIEKMEGLTVGELFSSKGESYFRQQESLHLRSLETKKQMVMATGGGTPCFSENMEWMNAHGLTIYLRVSDEVLFTRLKPEMNHRPLIAGKTDEQLKEFIRAKILEREKYYMTAKKIIQADDVDGEKLYAQL